MVQFKFIAVACFWTGVAALNTFSQNTTDRLSINDPAPELKYSKWIKGNPVSSIKGSDKIYVVEFWATWCGPCIIAMPHLSELAKKYKKEAVFIGANVWEKTGGKPYESSLQNVEKFVKGSGNRMSYHVIADNNAQDLVNSWLKPAGIHGIPASFVIKEGKIAWIGHPMDLDSIMNMIIAGTFDIAGFKKAYDDKANATAKSDQERRAFSDSVQNYIKAKAFDKAFVMLDRKVEDYTASYMNKNQKFKILLNNYSEKEAIDYAKELNKDKNFIASTSIAIVEKDSLSKESYLYAIEGLKEYLKGGKFVDIVYCKIAEGYHKSGHPALAIENQQLAIDVAKKELSNSTSSGRIFDYTIKEYEELLKKYQKPMQQAK